MKENVKFPLLDGVAPLQTFDAAAFIDDDPKTQKVCDFVLMLTLIFNDFKDLLWASQTLGDAAPSFEENFHETPQWGHFTGLDHHIRRLLAGLVVELARVLDDSKKTIALPLFQEVLGRLEAQESKHWTELCNPDSGLRRELTNIRDKGGFHYYFTDSRSDRVLADGYREVFSDPSRRPYLSIGRSPLESRFYFADAAALGMDKLVRTENWKEKFNAHAKRISNVLVAVVLLFLQIRGFERTRVNGSSESAG